MIEARGTPASTSWATLTDLRSSRNCRRRSRIGRSRPRTGPRRRRRPRSSRGRWQGRSRRGESMARRREPRGRGRPVAPRSSRSRASRHGPRRRAERQRAEPPAGSERNPPSGRRAPRREEPSRARRSVRRWARRRPSVRTVTASLPCTWCAQWIGVPSRPIAREKRRDSQAVGVSSPSGAWPRPENATTRPSGVSLGRMTVTPSRTSSIQVMEAIVGERESGPRRADGLLRVLRFAGVGHRNAQ